MPTSESDDIKARFFAMLDALPDDDERHDVILEIAERWCLECGRAQPDGRHCQCWNDE